MTTGGDAARRLDAVILAAGAGVRFGGGKLTAPWRAGRLIDGGLAAAFAAPARSVTLVWGADASVPETAREWAVANGVVERLNLVAAADHAQGLSASLKAGIASLAADCAGAFIFLGDMPRIPHEISSALAGHLTDQTLAAVPTYQGRRGHPVLIRPDLFAEVAALQGDQGLGAVLRRLGPALAEIEAPDDGVLFDVDRPGDLAGLG